MARRVTTRTRLTGTARRGSQLPKGLVPVLFFCAACLMPQVRAQSQHDDWLSLVAPIITKQEKQTYLALPAEARAAFEELFWTGKAITGEEYMRRVQAADAMFGGGKPGSGANTDQGRVYLSLGAPNRMTRLFSSRIFQPIEIWYYETSPIVPGTELRLLFYLRNGQGLYQLYSPTVSTFRDLLLPQSTLIKTFSPNDEITEDEIRANVSVPPAEDEVIKAAVAVATGVTDVGNDEILGWVRSPQIALREPPKTLVKSRLLIGPSLEIFESPSPYGGAQVDLAVNGAASRQVGITVIDDNAEIYRATLAIRGSESHDLRYLHRLDLLPGAYRVMISLDDKVTPFRITVPAESSRNAILFAAVTDSAGRAHTPFEFEGAHFQPSPDGHWALWATEQPRAVTWTIRRGAQVVWRRKTNADRVASIELPFSELDPGAYVLEAEAGDASASTRLNISHDQPETPHNVVTVSYNANLDPASRWAFVGHQWLLRHDLSKGTEALNASLAAAPSKDALMELARSEVLAERFDDAAERLRAILDQKDQSPALFEALCLRAYIATRRGQTVEALGYYQRALAIQDSPVIRKAITELSDNISYPAANKNAQ